MTDKIVIMMDPEKQGALRDGGVLPGGMFHSFDALDDESTGGLCFWPYKLNYEPPKDSLPLSLPAVMGLPDEKAEDSMASEILIGRIFNSLLLHIVFLDEEKTGDKATSRQSGFSSLSAVLDWGERLKQAIIDRFSEEQSRALRHVLVIVASGGLVHSDPKTIARLNDCFVAGSCLSTCFFLDYNLEPEVKGDIFHSDHVWPVMVGRLILRMMLRRAIVDDHAEDAVMRPGFHLWRAREFVFGYPEKNLKNIWSRQLKVTYADMAETLEAKTGDAPKVQGGPKVVPITLPELKAPPQIEDSRSWSEFDTANFVTKTNDDARWRGGRDELIRRIKEMKATRKSMPWMPQFVSVFTNVAQSPANVFKELENVGVRLGEIPPQDAEGLLGKWEAAINAERERMQAKSSFAKAGEEFARAQEHYVPRSLGMLAVLTISLFCGITIYRVVGAIGASQLFSVLLAGCVFGGAVAGWLLLTALHSRAGLCGLKRLKEMGRVVEGMMKDRYEKAFEAMLSGRRRHDEEDSRNALLSIQKLLARTGRILEVELQTPTVEVFFDDDEEDAVEARAETSLAERRLREFKAKTTTVEDLRKISLGEGDVGRAQSKMSEFFGGRNAVKGTTSFVAFWRNLCSSVDTAHLGNLPAAKLVPKLRGYMQTVCDKVTEALKDDVQAKGAEDNAPTSLQSVGQDTGFFLASAQVDFDNVVGGQTYNELYVPTRYCADVERMLRGASTTVVVRDSPLFSRLPHYGLYFQDIVVKPGLSENGRLKFETVK